MNSRWLKRWPAGFVVFCFLAVASVGLASAIENDTLRSLSFGGLSRSYRIHIPPGHDRRIPRPLLLVLHGGGGTGENMIKLTLGGFDKLADEEGFVVVYPDAVEKNWNDGRNGDETGYRAHQEKIDDVGFIAALIDTLQKELNIDPRRVYVTGISNGAMMSYRLACELSAKIMAAAPVAGNVPQSIASGCAPARPVSILMISNTKDPLMPFTGGDVTGPFGKKKLGQVLSAQQSIALWVKSNQCSSVPQITAEPDRDPADGTRVRREIYSGGREGTEVILYAIEGGGHTWPGGQPYLPVWVVGKVCQDIDANRVIWEFFKRHIR
jgi:polyhydroxybutyrate depolymerase